MDLGSVLIMIGITLLVVVLLARPLVERQGSLVTSEEHQLSALQAERDKILTMIRETELDHAMGKIRPEDFQVQRAAMVARGSSVLREIDARTDTPAAEPAEADVDAVIEAAIAARRTKPAAATAGFCTRCGQSLQAGDQFCARCGTPVPQGAQA